MVSGWFALNGLGIKGLFYGYRPRLFMNASLTYSCEDTIASSVIVDILANEADASQIRSSPFVLNS